MAKRKRKFFKKTFDSLKFYLEETIVQKKQVLFLTEVTSRYEALIHDIGSTDFKDSSPSSEKLLEKFGKENDKSIAIIKKNKGNMLFGTNMTVEDAIKKHQEQQNNEYQKKT